MLWFCLKLFMKALLVVLLSVLAAGTYQLSTGTVTGTVKGIPCLMLSPADCQKPMPNIELRFDAEVGGSSSSTVTAADGTFQLDLRPGKYKVHLQLPADGRVLQGPTTVTILPWAPAKADFVVPSGLM